MCKSKSPDSNVKSNSVLAVSTNAKKASCKQDRHSLTSNIEDKGTHSDAARQKLIFGCLPVNIVSENLEGVLQKLNLKHCLQVDERMSRFQFITCEFIGLLGKTECEESVSESRAYLQQNSYFKFCSQTQILCFM